MAYFEKFYGNHDEALRALGIRANAVIMHAQSLQPEDIEAQLAALSVDEDSVETPLEWVEVNDPRGIYDSPITVRPVIWFGAGSAEDARVKDKFDSGAWKVLLEAKLPTGTEVHFGDLTFFHVEGNLKSDPSLTVDHGDGVDRHVLWTSADAELFLTMLEGSFTAQPAK